MFQWALKKVFGTKHEREIKRLRPMVEAINQREALYAKLSDDSSRRRPPSSSRSSRNGARLEDIKLRRVRGAARGLASARSACATTTCS